MKEDLTLRQGLDQFYDKYERRLSHKKSSIPVEVKSFFKSHDVAHVIFGCDITLYGEGSVKIWTIFGTTLGFWKHIDAYRKANAYELAQNFSPKHLLSNLFKFLLCVPLLIVRARKMKKLWPWSDFDQYLDWPISEIRKEFNIQIVK